MRAIQGLCPYSTECSMNDSALPSHEGVDTGPHVEEPAADAPPERLGRYRITAKLGSGGFGVVYKGFYDHLRRPVAIKLPHPKPHGTAADLESYPAQARNVLQLHHSHAAPVDELSHL